MPGSIKQTEPQNPLPSKEGNPPNASQAMDTIAHYQCLGKNPGMHNMPEIARAGCTVYIGSLTAMRACTSLVRPSDRVDSKAGNKLRPTPTIVQYKEGKNTGCPATLLH